MAWTWINAEYSPKQENLSAKQELLWFNYHSALIPGETKEEAIERIKRNNLGCDFRNFEFIEDNSFDITKSKIAQVPNWKLDKIYNALRITSNIHNSRSKITAHDRMVIEALDFVWDLLLKQGVYVKTPDGSYQKDYSRV